MSRSLKAHLLLVAVTMVWGATFTVIKDALREISPLLFNAVRMTLATACLAVVYWKAVREMDRRTFRAGVILGIFLWLGYEFQTSGLRITTPSKSAFITGLSVILVPVILAMFFRSRLNVWTAGGVVAALFGLFLMTVPAGEGGADWASVNAGDLLTLGCAVAFAFHIVLMGRFTKKFPFQPLAVLQTATAALLMAFTIPVFEHPHASWNSRVIAAILVTGLIATAAAFTIQAWAQQFTPATHTALIFALEPVFAWLTAYLVEGEKLGARATIGALLILAGVLLSELKGTSGPIAEPV